MNESEKRLEGRRIVVTGAASGIGRATAMLFARQGAALALIDRDEQGMGDMKGHAIAADVRDEDSVAAAIATAAHSLGGLDGLVNVAGVFETARMEDTSTEMWQRALAVNLTGPFLVTRAALRHLRAAEAATIVNLGSASAIVPFPQLSAYGATKGAMATLTKVWAAEFAPKIRVNIVCPGMTRTRMVSAWQTDPDALAERVKGSYALQRIAEPEEIANAILFLTSLESSFVTGTTLVVDGGRTFY